MISVILKIRMGKDGLASLCCSANVQRISRDVTNPRTLYALPLEPTGGAVHGTIDEERAEQR